MTQKERKEWFEDERNWVVQDRTSDDIFRLKMLILIGQGPTICRLEAREKVYDWARSYKEGKQIYKTIPVTKQIYNVTRNDNGEIELEPISKTQALELLKEGEKL